MLSIEQARAAILSGKVVGVPTSTYYAVSADIRSTQGIESVYRLKNRSHDKPSLALVDSIATALSLISVEPSHTILLMMQTFWPGPLTLVLPAPRPDISPLVSTPTGIAVRWDANPLLSRLLDPSLPAITGTSANLSGQTPLQLARDVDATFGGKTDYAGSVGMSMTKGGAPSTLLDLTDSKPKILRQGPVTKEQIAVVMEKQGVVL